MQFRRQVEPKPVLYVNVQILLFVRSQKLVSPKCGLRRCHRTERSKCKLEHQKHPSSLFCGFKFLTAQQIAVCRQEASAKKRTEETCAAQISLSQFQKRAT